MKHRRLAVFAACCAASLFLATLAAFAGDETPAPGPAVSARHEDALPSGFEGDPYEMNGIRLKDYPDFEKKWRLVTVRFRTDTGEQRFTYANDDAYDALIKKVKDYPDGAVFAKIGIMTKEDPAFTNSRVPSGARRIQFMVRDKEKYAATGGWGYALFALDGKRLDPSPPQKQAEACDVCHQIVKESRGEVFSQPADLRAAPAPGQVTEGQDLIFKSQEASFRDRAADTLPLPLRKLLPPGAESVRSVEGTLRDHVIYGTLNEIQPLLIKEFARSGHPAVFLDREETRYSLVFPADPKDPMSRCSGGGRFFKIYWSSFIGNDIRIAVTRGNVTSTCVLPSP